MSSSSSSPSPPSSSYNFKAKIEENRGKLQPPVCNHMLHNAGPLKIMIVGGPNTRKDYHINQGEEIFYQIEGDMCLKVMEQGSPTDIVIKQGEIFVLPARIPHSPQRFANTVGLVIERERGTDELDGLRYFVDEENKEVLWQRYFQCTNLGAQLVPLITEFFASEEFTSRVPKADSVVPAPFDDDTKSMLRAPYPLAARFPELRGGGGAVKIDSKEYACELVGNGTYVPPTPIETECWVWQICGESVVNGEALSEGCCALYPKGIADWGIGADFQLSPRFAGGGGSPAEGATKAAAAQLKLEQQAKLDAEKEAAMAEAAAAAAAAASTSAKEDGTTSGPTSASPRPTIALLVYCVAVPEKPANGQW